MNVYVETNFVLELALLQKQHESCAQILSICETGRAILVLPAFCIAEPYETLVGRARRRSNIARELGAELTQLRRSEPYREELTALQNLTSILIKSGQEEKSRLDQVLDRILSLAEVIPLGREILGAAIGYQSRLDLSPPDSIVYASVIEHLNTTSETRHCFLNRDTKGFDDPDIVNQLAGYRCKLFPRFDHGYSYIKSQIGNAD